MTRSALRSALCLLLAFQIIVPAIVLVSSGCGPTVLYVRSAPPHPKHEVIPPRPNVKAVWIEGHWMWTGHEYVWMPGHWELKPKGKAWAAGHWKKTPHGWKWVPGHWRK